MSPAALIPPVYVCVVVVVMDARRGIRSGRHDVRAGGGALARQQVGPGAPVRPRPGREGVRLHGEEALDLLSEIQLAPDVLLLDCQLGSGMTGPELYQRIAALYGPIPARMISAR